ncbi:helix-turn-helix domain-containing protein [Niabella sp. CC-SYL272]|uniref:helix-turn-helix domain-containing protein n=1 Tax=Niabella agricola TaxID=2891571 RepID=UPI001F3FB52F|nr:helix-turn-helix domain-containing protein [Niabella agricola]MCF3108013.1 helix-turn-helix domain-containing protein [Niabella agricola]
MNASQGLFYFISGLSTLNGFLFGSYLLFLNKSRVTHHLLLGFLLLLLSVKLGDAVFSYFHPDLSLVYIQMGLSACLLIGPTLYFYARSCIFPQQVFFRNWKVSFLPFMALIVIGLMYPMQLYPEIWKQYLVKLVYAIWFSGLAVTCVFYWKYKDRFREGSYFRYILLGNIIYYTGFSGMMKGPVCIVGAIAFTLLTYLKIYEVFRNNPEERSSIKKPEKYQHKKIPGKQADLLIQKLEKIVLEEKLYLLPDIKLGDVASRSNMTNHQLSQLLNDNLKQRFSAFINGYRIKEACKLIVEKPHIRIEEIGYEVGFNSKSTFFTVFKKLTGITPMQYREGVPQTTPSY